MGLGFDVIGFGGFLIGLVCFGVFFLFVVYSACGGLVVVGGGVFGFGCWFGLVIGVFGSLLVCGVFFVRWLFFHFCSVFFVGFGVGVVLA